MHVPTPNPHVLLAIAGSCGTCYEVACRPSHIKDGYGENMDRTGSCRGGSVIVRVTDTCPCHYPSNAYSNTRWCEGLFIGCLLLHLLLLD